ncbi:MAG TPA: class I adenylate-forming enzyme family protein [Enhygromyxa sp.]|nr:class I adenylate-forming enzyme family protein [Enhygromyxa sp.]
MPAHPWSSVYAELGLDWSEVPEIPNHTLSGYIRAHASSFPEREAIVYLGAGISYAQLDRLADHLAAWLRDHGCVRGDVIGIQLPNTPQYVVALVAAARLGLATTSISPLLRPGEIRHQANDAGVKLLLTLAPLFDALIRPILGEVPTLRHVLVSGPTDLLPGATAASFEPSQIGELEIHPLAPALAHPCERPIEESGELEQILYLQYTGGTTGVPKAARLSSRNLFINNAQADVFYGYRLGQELVASAFPLFHIGGIAVLFNALRMAATTILVPDPRNLDHFCAELQRRPATVIAAVPALFQMLVAHPVFRSLDFTSLRLAVSGGSPFSEADIRQLEALIGPGKFCEVYGMTETSPVQTLNPAKRLKPGFVGIPLPGTEVRIVDVVDRTRTMPLGEPGEIIAAGPQVMSGYLGARGPKRAKHDWGEGGPRREPGGTAGASSAVLDEPDDALRTFDGRTWMYTGDIGFMDDEGYVKVCDRSKDMIIVGGFKVFSVEVENKLLELPQVGACAVVGRPDPERPGSEIVTLHVQRAAGCGLDDDALRELITAHCRANMAAYKVPKQIVVREALPLTSVGKIDKKALRDDGPSCGPR